MLLTITTTHTPATDLGYLLHKHPARVRSFRISFGQARVFYPEASSGRCTAALERFIAREPLRRVHECVFGVLALESEPVDPRL